MITKDEKWICKQAMMEADIIKIGTKILHAYLSGETSTETITLFNGTKILIDTVCDINGIMQVHCFDGIPEMMGDDEIKVDRVKLRQSYRKCLEDTYANVFEVYDPTNPESYSLEDEAKLCDLRRTLDPDDEHRFNENMQSAQLAEGKSEYEMITKDGRKIIIMVRRQPDDKQHIYIRVDK